LLAVITPSESVKSAHVSVSADDPTCLVFQITGAIIIHTAYIRQAFNRPVVIVSKHSPGRHGREQGRQLSSGHLLYTSAASHSLPIRTHVLAQPTSIVHLRRRISIMT
jgi:hypothetical protein